MGVRLVLFVFASVALGVTLSQSAVRSADGGLVILAPADPYTVEFTSRTAKLELTVQNGSDRLAALQVTLFDASRNLSINIATPPDAAGVGISASPGSLPAGEIKKIDVTLQAGNDVDPGKFKGVLVVSAAGISAATLNLVGAKAPGQFTVAKAQPASVTMTVTRLWPSVVPIRADRWMPELIPNAGGPNTLWYDGDTARYEVFIKGAIAEPLPEPIDTYLSSDTGGRLLVQLRDFAATGSGLRAIVRLGDSDRAGKYTGKFILDPKDEKAPTVDMTVNVQDFVVWPLLVLLAGALGAYRIASRRDRDRPREIAVAELLNARHRYDAQAKTATDVEESWVLGLFRNKQPSTEIPPETLAKQLERRLKDAKVQTQLDKVVAEIADLILLADSWPDLRRAAEVLRKAAEDRRIDPQAHVFTRADNLLAVRSSGFRTADQAKAFLAELNDQVAAIELVRKANEVRTECTTLWNLLSASQKRDLVTWNPDAFWRSEVRGRGTKQELVEARVVSELIHVLRMILAYAERDRAGLQTMTVADATQMSNLFAAVDQVARRLDTADLTELEKKTVDSLDRVTLTSPSVILARISALDTLEFVVVAGAAIGIFLVALYIDKNFGTFWNYAAVFLAALSGTLVINWQLLPWYRKYTLVVAPKV